MSLTAERELELFEVMRQKLYTAVVSDSLDQLGAREQVMRHDVRPLFPEAVVAGRAFTVLSQDRHEMPANPYEGEIAAVDSLKPGDVCVWSTNDSLYSGIWGELLSTAATARGAAGAVIDGAIRDVRRIIDMRFPVFCRAIRPVDSAGRSVVTDFQVAVRAGGVRVHPGDYIFGDIDGVVVIPKDLFEPCMELAIGKATRENHSRDEIRAGKLLRDVYNKYGVL